MSNLAPGPFVKWAGGKRRLAKELLKYVPEKFGSYHEPFLGGGAFYFFLQSQGKIHNGACLSDSLCELTNTFRQVRDSVEEVINSLETHVYTKEHYETVRNIDPLTLSPADRAARFIYLNKTCFNGLHRVNKNGKFNVPFGKYKNPKFCDPKGLRLASDALENTRISCSDYQTSCQFVQKGDLVYLDPPYIPASPTAKFTSYVAEGFGLDQHTKLRDTVSDLIKRGAYVILSNSATELTDSLYQDFNREEIYAGRSINSDGKKRGKVKEYVILGNI